MLAGHRVPTAGPKGGVHIEQVLEYNRDSSYLRDAVLYRLTIEAQRRVEASALSKREIVRQLGHYGSEMSHAARPALRAFWLAPWQPVLFGFLLAGDWIDTGLPATIQSVSSPGVSGPRRPMGVPAGDDTRPRTTLRGE